MATTASNATNSTKLAVEFVSEALVPGGSNLVKGDFAQGAIHLVLGVAAVMTVGPLGLLAVKANSLSKAHTGQSLLDKVTG